jgi:hypothetical protein
MARESPGGLSGVRLALAETSLCCEGSEPDTYLRSHLLVDIAALRIEVVIPSNDLRDSDMAGLTLSDAVTCIVRLQCVDVALFGKTQVGTGLREVSAVGLQFILV